MIRLFRVFIPKSVLGLLLSDFLLLFACLLLPTYLLIPSADIYLLYEDGLTKITFLVVTLMMGLYYQNLYTDIRVRNRMMLMQQVILTVGVGLMVQAVLAYVVPDLMAPRWSMLAGLLLIIILLPLWRIAYSVHGYKGLGTERVLFLGADAVGIEMAQEFDNRPELGFVVVGFVDNVRPPGTPVGGSSVLGPVSELARLVADFKPARIVANLEERRESLPVMTLLDLRFNGLRIEEAATLYETMFGRVTIRKLRPSQLIFSSELNSRPSSMRLQVIYSMLLGVVGFILAAPVMVLVAIAVKITSPGPILFRQKRVGLNGSTFTLYKFRSMVANAEAKTGAVWAKRDDPRVTPLGRIMRRSRLDELPQLINVLRGEMSVIGPRPERPEFVATLSEQIPFYRQRHCVRPGLTGWAQINYKYGETIQDAITKLEYDLYYIKNLSPALDSYIVFHTVKVMLFSQLGQ
jgi:sugar transferase (PEP-CTERM system associated)